MPHGKDEWLSKGIELLLILILLYLTWIKSFQQVLVEEPDLAESGDTKALENGADSDVDDGMDRMVYNNYCLQYN